MFASLQRGAVPLFTRGLSSKGLKAGSPLPNLTQMLTGPQKSMVMSEDEKSKAKSDPSWSAQQRTMVDRIFYSPVAVTESAIRQDLKTAHRLMAKYRMDDLVWNHISARCGASSNPEEGCCDLSPDTFLITPGGMHFSEIRNEDLVFDSIEESGNVIHSGIYSARPDVISIIHTHTPAIQVVSVLETGFQFLTQDSAPFFNKIGYHDWGGVNCSETEKKRISDSLGKDGAALFLRNHGGVVVGRSIQEAWVRMYYLDRCCQVQIQAMSSGGKYKECDPEMLIHAASQVEQFFPHGKYEWRALSRLVDK
jgi:ribulose-5-phosphate 4-epimerase/fuculose-1-phosphate aldolase